MGAKCDTTSDCQTSIGLQCRDGYCRDKPEWAIAAVIISGIASLLIGFAIGYLVQHCRMKRKMQIEGVNDELMNEDSQHGESKYHRPTSINQDVTHTGGKASEGEDQSISMKR